MRQKFTQLIRLLALVISVAFLAKAQAADYDVVKRYKILEDKMKTAEMLTPFGHDFLIDINALVNKDVTNFIDEADQASKTGTTDAEKLAAAQDFLKKYDKTEQNVRIGFTLGVPLPSFTAWGVKIVPDLRAQAGLGVLMGIQTSNLTVAEAVEYLGSDIPDFAKTALLSCTAGIVGGTDLVAHLIDSSCGLTVEQKAVLEPYRNKYFYPNDTTVPDIHNYLKGEAKVGLNLNYEKGEHWFGGLNLYALGRADLSVRVSANAIAKDSNAFDLGEEMNTTVNMASDLKFGYRNGNLRGYAAVEELKIARMSDNEDKGVKLLYGEDPLLRLHGEYIYKFIGFNVRPFVGVHQRSGYDFADGVYGGSDLGFYVWGERIGVNVRGMIDNEHFTFSPMAKLWVMHLQYMLKVPVKSEVNGVKPSTLHSVNFRLFF